MHAPSSTICYVVDATLAKFLFCGCRHGAAMPDGLGVTILCPPNRTFFSLVTYPNRLQKYSPSGPSLPLLFIAPNVCTSGAAASAPFALIQIYTDSCLPMSRLLTLPRRFKSDTAISQQEANISTRGRFSTPPTRAIGSQTLGREPMIVASLQSYLPLLRRYVCLHTSHARGN